MLFLRELKKVVFSFSYILFVIIAVFALFSQDVFNFTDNKISEPVVGENYGTKNEEIPELIMPAALQSLYAEFLENNYKCYPIGFFKNVKLNDDEQALQLADFDENNAISQTKAVFDSKSFTLGSKGAIIPVSRELLLDANSNVLAIISNVFGTVYRKTVNKAITGLVETDTTEGKQSPSNINDAIDAIKKAVIETKTAFGGPTIVVGKAAWAKLALAKDAQERYLLARDANNSTIKAIEGCTVLVVDDKDISANTVLVGDFSAIYHIAFPSLEIASSEHAGFGTNSVHVRAVCRFTNLDVYKEAFTQITLP